MEATILEQRGCLEWRAQRQPWVPLVRFLGEKQCPEGGRTARLGNMGQQHSNKKGNSEFRVQGLGLGCPSGWLNASIHSIRNE